MSDMAHTQDISSSTDLTAQQALFLEYLFNDPECSDGNIALAAEKAGYAKGSHLRLAKSLRKDILERTQLELVVKAPKAAQRLVGMMDEDGSTPKADIRLKAIESVLDRTGLSKKQEIAVDVGGDASPIFFIPAKSIATLDEQTEENTFQ